MIKVYQEHLHHGQPGAENGDCLRACVASLLELPRDEVPHFLRHPEAEYLTRIHEYFNGRGLLWQCFRWDKSLCDHFGPRYPLVIAGGKSPRGAWGHFVVAEIYRGGIRTIHDPHPSNLGLLGEPEDFVMFAQLFEAKS